MRAREIGDKIQALADQLPWTVFFERAMVDEWARMPGLFRDEGDTVREILRELGELYDVWQRRPPAERAAARAATFKKYAGRDW